MFMLHILGVGWDLGIKGGSINGIICLVTVLQSKMQGATALESMYLGTPCKHLVHLLQQICPQTPIQSFQPPYNVAVHAHFHVARLSLNQTTWQKGLVLCYRHFCGGRQWRHLEDVFENTYHFSCALRRISPASVSVHPTNLITSSLLPLPELYACTRPSSIKYGRVSQNSWQNVNKPM